MGLIVDNFAGGGGASTGIFWATGRHPDIAVNHDKEAIAVHAANHPTTRHYQEDVWHVDPMEATGGQPVGLAWFSPDCTHFSRAKGSAPRSNKRRGLAGVAIRWARRTRPRLIILENVEEFASWGPLCKEGKPIAERAGESFEAWQRSLKKLGYIIEWRTLVAADYGAPTTRKRLYLVARCDGAPIVWPEPTHTPEQWVPASSCIQWDVLGTSIFDRPRPLSPKTMERIARGIQRFVVDGDESCFIAKHYTGVTGQSLKRPMPTVTTIDHSAIVSAFFVAYYGSEKDGASVECPMRTVTTKDRFALVRTYGIQDITMRMLTARELARAQGFPDTYDFSAVSETSAKKLIGNSVCPHVAEAIVRANYAEK